MILLCFCFLTKQFFSKNTGITVFDIIAVLSLTMAILIVGKISNLKVRLEVYCAYCYLARY